MAVKINIKDTDAAHALCAKLDVAIQDITGIVANQKKVASDIKVFTNSVGLNEQAAEYLEESYPQLEKVIPQLETISAQLKNGVASMRGFEEMAAAGGLKNI